MPPQRHAQQEPDPGHDPVAIADAGSALDQMQLEQANIVGRCRVGRALQVGRKSLATGDLATLRMRAEPSTLAGEVQLDADPQAMRRRRETVEHPFGTIKARMGATHFLMKTLPRVASEMALQVLAYNLTRVMNIVGTKALMVAIRA